MKDHSRCNRLRMCLAEVGLNTRRVICFDEDDLFCVINDGPGDGYSGEDAARLMDRAISIAGVAEQRRIDGYCTCSQPLVGERPGVGPRCRLCNRMIHTDGTGAGS